MKKCLGGDEVSFVAAMEADLSLEGAVGLEVGPSVALSLVHLVVAGPGEGDRVAAAACEDLAVTQPKANSPEPFFSKRM
ncbi:MAG: hypothetical protein WDN24_19245 [Sphingomonas sp.]